MTPIVPTPKPERTPPKKPQFLPRIGAKKLAALGGKFPFSSIAPSSKGKRKIGRNAIRKIREFARCFHSKERVEFVKRLPCAATGKFGNIDNAHVCDDGTKGIGRRSGYRCIVPLNRDAHRLLHRHPTRFYNTYGAFDWPNLAAYTELQWQRFSGHSGASE